MTGIKFYKATSRGGIDPIDNSADSLHYRRSIVIDDPTSSTFWIIHGSGAAKKTQKSAEKNAEKMKNDSDMEYNIIHIDYDDAESKINELLSQKESPDTGKLFPIPEVPGKSSKKSNGTKKKEEDGPIIREFQISYYQEDSDESKDIDSSPDDDMIKSVLLKISEYVNQVDSIIQNSPGKNKSAKILRSLSDDIVDIIHRR